MAAEWIAAEMTAQGLTGWPVTAGTPGAAVTAPDLPGLVAVLGPAPVIGIGFGGTPRPVPCTPLPDGLASTGGARLVPPLADRQFLSQTSGAEVRIAGFLHRHDRWDGVICVTGESHLWAHVSAGEVVSFQSFDTGRLARLLDLGDDWQGGSFAAALDEVMARPEKLAAVLARANLLADRKMGWGALIGAELAAARMFWLGQQVAVIGDGAGAAAVVAALAAQAVPAEQAGGLEILIAGLNLARSLPET